MAVRQRAEAIHEAAVERVGADPDPAVRGGIDLLDRALAMLGHLADEIVVRLAYRQVDETL